LILPDEIQFLVRNASTVIPACPESFPPQRKDSKQAGMTKVCVARQHMNNGYSNLLHALAVLNHHMAIQIKRNKKL
jgi:hypothetical protein